MISLQNLAILVLCCTVVAVAVPDPRKNANENSPDVHDTANRKLLHENKPFSESLMAQLSRHLLKESVSQLSRHLLQEQNSSPSPAPESSPSPAPTPEASAPGPTPLPTSPIPPPVNPFNTPPPDDLVCCCRTTQGSYEDVYQEPTPNGCCCGSRNSCCIDGGLVNIICGGGHVCGILMLFSALIAVMMLSICMTGSFFARRRRRLQALNDVHVATPVGGGAPGARYSAANPQFLHIPDSEIEGLRVKAACEPQVSVSVGGDEPSPTANECSICLDTVAVHPDTWAVFPCSHGCCRPCVDDLVRHSSRRVNATTLAVMCPLCRKAAVAPLWASSATDRAADVPIGNNIDTTAAAAIATPTDTNADVLIPTVVLSNQTQPQQTSSATTTVNTWNPVGSRDQRWL